MTLNKGHSQYNVNAWCILMSESVTVESLIMRTSIVLEELLTRDRHAATCLYVNFFQSLNRKSWVLQEFCFSFDKCGTSACVNAVSSSLVLSFLGSSMFFHAGFACFGPLNAGRYYYTYSVCIITMYCKVCVFFAAILTFSGTLVRVTGKFEKSYESLYFPVLSVIPNAFALFGF